jgi:hypothetical protein
MGRYDDAERHFTVALEANVRTGALPWVAHTRHDLALMLLKRAAPADRARAIQELYQAHEIALTLGQVALQEKVAIGLASLGVDREASIESTPPPPELQPTSRNVFRREGEYWLVAFEGHESRLHDAKGLAYLAVLLANPGREIHSLDLVTTGIRSPVVARTESELATAHGPRDAGPVLDDQAKRAYRERIQELEAELDEAEDWHDPERAARARHELDFLIHELAAATGLAGRDRRLGSDAERARVNVTRAIRSALARIREHDPELGRHLDQSVRTGIFCSYQVDARAQIKWML